MQHRVNYSTRDTQLTNPDPHLSPPALCDRGAVKMAQVHPLPQGYQHFTLTAHCKDGYMHLYK